MQSYINCIIILLKNHYSGLMRTIIFILLISTSISCNFKKKDKSILKNLVESIQNTSLREINISELSTDDFSKMVCLNKEQFTYIFQDSSSFQDSTFYIHSKIPNDQNYLLIMYQKNYETDSFRVDYIKLLSINKDKKTVDSLILSVLDNRVIQHEVFSSINNDTLTVMELQSSEPYFNPNHDTLYSTITKICLNSKQGINTISQNKTFEVRLD